MFYLDNVFPYLFPLYRPSLVRDGGRAWVLEMMLKSPAIRQAALCQSSLFFTLVQRTEDPETVWQEILLQAGNAFSVLRGALEVRLAAPGHENLHCTVRLLASIIQLQRFEVAILSFDNCQQHLNAALDLFYRLMNNTGAVEPSNHRAMFKAVLYSLQPSSWECPLRQFKVACAEQAAFRFSSALLILDDIVASTALQEPPKLLDYHEDLLGSTSGADDTFNLETIIGCQNWVLLQLGKISALDAWKQKRKKAGNLNVMELVRQAASIHDALQSNLERLSSDPHAVQEKTLDMLNVFPTDFFDESIRSLSQITTITRIWAHAAFAYLAVVVSGWQPASLEMRYNAARVIELIAQHLKPPALLRTVVWPFCVAGCLAELSEEACIRRMVEGLQPANMFGTIRKALEIMENVWASRESAEATSRDISTCLRSDGGLILLV